MYSIPYHTVLQVCLQLANRTLGPPGRATFFNSQSRSFYDIIDLQEACMEASVLTWHYTTKWINMIDWSQYDFS